MSASSPSRARQPSAAPPVLTLLPAIPDPGLAAPVRRERLIRRLLGIAGSRVVVLTAPAGYGKTTLLHGWAQDDPRPFHWPALGRRPRLTAELAAHAEIAWGRGEPAVLVLDDAEAALGPTARRAVERLADDVPVGSLLVVVSRGASLLPVGRRRTARDVVELGPQDLAMTRGEIAATLRLSKISVGDGAVAALLASTEGWPAAVSLAALVIAAAPDAELAARRFDGNDPTVVDYVREELLGALSREHRRFLTRTSILAMLDGDICDHVLATTGSRTVLDDLAGCGLPLSPVGRSAERLHCHPLLRAVLAGELRRREPERAAALHRRAAAWFDDRDRVDLALAHATAAGDLDHVERLLWRAAPTCAFDGNAAALEDWLAAIPARDRHERAALALTAATSEVARGRLDRAAHWAAIGKDRLAGAPADLRPALEGVIAAVDAVALADGARALRSRAAHALELTPEVSPWRAMCCLLDGAAAWLTGDGDHARAALEEGARRGVIAAPGVAAICEAQLALAALCAEDWETGAGLAERALSRAEATGTDDVPLFAVVFAVAALARAHRGRLGEARANVATAARLLERLEGSAPWLEAQVLLALGRTELRLSDVAAARAAITAAARAASRVAGADALRAHIDDTARQAETFSAAAPDAADPLTTAELRVLRFLPSHLSFREIGAGLHVSPNTIKSQAHAIYRKLGASSRSRAVERARALGLLDTGAVVPPPVTGRAT